MVFQFQAAATAAHSYRFKNVYYIVLILSPGHLLHSTQQGFEAEARAHESTHDVDDFFIICSGLVLCGSAAVMAA